MALSGMVCWACPVKIGEFRHSICRGRQTALKLSTITLPFTIAPP